jgi:hypothetical protein
MFCVQEDVLGRLGRVPVDAVHAREAAHDNDDAYNRVLRAFDDMLDNLWYISVHQMKRRRAHSDSLRTDLADGSVLAPADGVDPQQYRDRLLRDTASKMATEVMSALPGFRSTLSWNVSGTVFVVPSVAVELSVLQRAPGGGPGLGGPAPVQGYRVRSPFFHDDQGIRLHMERRRPVEESQVLAERWEAREERRARAGHDPERVPRLQLQPYPSFGSRSPTGPSGYKMSLDGQAAALAADGPILYGLCEVLEPMPVARGQEKVTPVLSVYETWIRNHEKDSIMFARQKDYKGVLHALLAPEYQVKSSDKTRVLQTYVRDLVRDDD